MQNLSFDPFVRKLHQMVPNFEPSITQYFQAYHSTHNNPRSLNRSPFLSRTVSNHQKQSSQFRIQKPIKETHQNSHFQHVFTVFPLKFTKIYQESLKICPENAPKSKPQFLQIHLKQQAQMK